MGGRFGNTVTATVVTAVAAIVMLLGTPTGPALAHNSLTGSNPKDGARLARPPAAVQLTFLSRVEPARARITVTGPDGTSAAAAAPRYSGTKVTVPLRTRLAGRYLIAYRLASDDGHPVEGSLRFTVTTGASPTVPATPGGLPPTAPGGAASATPAGSPAPAAEPARAQDDTGTGTGWGPWTVAAVLVLVLLALGIGGFLLRGRRHRPTG